MLDQNPSVVPKPSKRTGRLKALVRDPAAAFGLFLVALVVLVAIFGPILISQDPTKINPAQALQAPSGEHWFGTDELGRDTFSRVVAGARVSITVSLLAASLACVVGVSIGVAAALRRGWIDSVLMRSMDMVFSFPALLLALLFVSVLGSDMRNLIIALGIVYTPTFARVARGATLAVVAEPFIEAARSVGVPSWRKIRRYVLPNIAAPVSVQFTVSIAYAIIVEASLSYLGLGVQPPAPSWGNMLSAAKPLLEISPWPALFPGLAIALTVLGFNLFGDGLRDALDPRIARVMKEGR